MARRKKTTPEVHRETIAAAAERLFLEKGIQAVTMDDISKEAGYSKATLYVYFQNKDDMIGELTLQSMQMLLAHIRAGITSVSGTRLQYDAICRELVRYRLEYPLYFDMVLREINVDFEKPDTLEVEKKIFETGERINDEIAGLLRNGIEQGAIRSSVLIPQTVFLFWASLSGVIMLAANKEAYLNKTLHTTSEEFLRYCFDVLYMSIENKKTVQP